MNEMNAAYLDLNDPNSLRVVFMVLKDNDDWQYTRLGFGKDHVGLFIVDLEDMYIRMQPRKKFYINEKYSVEDVLAIGVACGVLEKYEDGDPRGDYGVRVDEEAADLDFLLKRVQA